MTELAESKMLMWYLSKYGKDRGYHISKKELRKLIHPYSENELEEMFVKWLEEKRQVDE